METVIALTVIVGGKSFHDLNLNHQRGCLHFTSCVLYIGKGMDTIILQPARQTKLSNLRIVNSRDKKNSEFWPIQYSFQIDLMSHHIFGRKVGQIHTPPHTHDSITLLSGRSPDIHAGWLELSEHLVSGGGPTRLYHLWGVGFIAWLLRCLLGECWRGPVISHLLRMIFDFCTVSTIKWPCATFWLVRKSDTYPPHIYTHTHKRIYIYIYSCMRAYTHTLYIYIYIYIYSDISDVKSTMDVNKYKIQKPWENLSDKKHTHTHTHIYICICIC